MSDLKTMVHVESRSLSCRVWKTSATPVSPPRVADRIGSTYFVFGAASCLGQQRFMFAPGLDSP